MTGYKRRKEQARQEAIDWQRDFNNNNFSYSELAYYMFYFTQVAKRYGLTKEFRENGII